MALLDSFSVFNFNEGVPYVSITRNGVTFNKSVIMKLKYPRHVILLINAKEKLLAIQSCNENTPNSVVFHNDEKQSNVLSVRWNNKDLLNNIKAMTGWDYSKESYRIEGTLLPEESAMLFDLNQAELLN